MTGVTLKLEEQAHVAVKLARRAGAKELRLEELDVGAGRPPWILAEYLGEDRLQNRVRISRSGAVERVRTGRPEDNPGVRFLAGEVPPEETIR